MESFALARSNVFNADPGPIHRRREGEGPRPDGSLIHQQSLANRGINKGVP